MSIKSFSLLFLLLVISISTVSAQNQNGFGFKYVIPDFQTPISGDFKLDVEGVKAGEIAYYRTLGKSALIGVPFRMGKVKYPRSTTDVNLVREQAFFSLDFTGILRANNGKLLPEDAFIAPYVLAGVGASYYEKERDQLQTHAPVGVGINWRLMDGLSLQTQTEYRFARDNHFHHSIGLFANLNGKAETPEPVIEEPVSVAPSDKDKDGVIDTEDKCPDVAGLSQFAGCPDTDGDGIEDSADKCPNEKGTKALDGCPVKDADGDGIADGDDKCPTVKGIARFNGCPDTDGDGIQDSADKCPNEKGTEANNGCPVKDADGDGIADGDDKCPTIKGIARFGGCPDTDGDGIEDSADRCPKQKGIAANNGCPEIKEEVRKVLNFAKRGVKFETGSSTIKTSSYNILDQVAQILLENPAYNLRIEGYTDNVGNDTNNLNLSKKRAKACHDYLAKKGIAENRMTHQGFGEINPVADNKTPAGRAQNRRVEFNIFFTGKK